MKKAEHLLVCLAEECAEIQQAVSKALRFGLDDGSPDKTTTNAEDIQKELVDLLGVIALLGDEGIMTFDTTKVDVPEKKAKVRKYMDYARERGTLERDYVYDDSDSFADWEKG